MGRIRARHVLLLWLVVYFPWLPGWPLNHVLPEMPNSFVIDANLAGEYTLIAFSLVILTGWVGQISLGQGSFVGVGAFTTGLLARSLDIPFPLNLPLVALVGAAVASLLGVVALRVRGLYLAVATLIFAWMADAYLFGASWFVGSGGSSSISNKPIGSRESVTFFDFTNKRVFYLVIVAAVAAAWYGAINLRDSKTGRAFFAIRGSEMAAVSLGIDITRYKLLAFALSGGLAGIAGNILMTDVRTVTPLGFQFTQSLFYLSIAVVGGLTSLGGALAASILFSGLTEAFYRLSFLTGWSDVVTVGLLLVVLLYYPGGLGALGLSLSKRTRSARRLVTSQATGVVAGLWARIRRREPTLDTADPAAIEVEVVEQEPSTLARSRRRFALPSLPRRTRRAAITRHSINLTQLVREAPLTTEEIEVHVAPPQEERDWRTADVRDFALPPDRLDRRPILEADGVIVRFGGLTAVNNVSLAVREHEIVGLIGPNGAGKTTTFNAIAGLNEPTAGRVTMFGQDATAMPVHVRAQMGVGRTFQLIQLFPQLTVFDNLLVATHVQNDTGVFSHITLTGRAIMAEAEARHRVHLVIGLLGLEEVADREVAGLPFGILRQVEIARALVTESPLLMLDEPASGLDNAETDELAQLLYFLRAELGVTILLIEHDVRMVTSVCDYIYVINRGELLAEGTAADIQRNPDVVAAYLGQAEETAEV
jgi:ABC-type branched-subunit amino acid transport system ATPase component/ABC-type branched-subunit amino acid transport system permease subunit